MRYISKEAPKLVLAATIVALGFIGGHGKATLAQDPVKQPAAPKLTEALPAAALPLPAAVGVPGIEPAAPPALAPVPAQRPGSPTASSPSAPREEAAPLLGGEVTAGPTIVQPIASESVDPEKEAASFVEQNQKLAESQLQKLKAEEAKLRARLQKVEGGIKRWEALLSALKQSQGSAVVSAANPSAGWKERPPTIDSEPQDLAPIPNPAALTDLPKR